MNTLVPTLSQPVYQYHPEALHPIYLDVPRIVIPGVVAPNVLPI